MSRTVKRGTFNSRRQLQRCAESGAPRICFSLGFPEPHNGQCEALPLAVTRSQMSSSSSFEFSCRRFVSLEDVWYVNVEIGV